MRWGKQYRFCPNCGRAHYDDLIGINHVLSLCCDQKCRDQWERKYAAKILGHAADPPGNVSLEIAACNDARGYASYKCPKCGTISHHPMDLKHRYCAVCHEFENA